MNSKLHTTLTILCVIFFNLFSNAQSGQWTFGLNGGTAYQQSDICILPGWGTGLTLGKNIYHRPNGLIDVDLRGRYLFTQTRGADHFRSYGITNNTLLNGTTGEIDSYATSPGFAFQNHKTNIHELSIEAVLIANRLRERTGVELAVFGGAGLDIHLANSDQSVLSNNYDYSVIDTAGKRRSILNNLNAIQDGYHESWADGYSDGTRVSFMPSVGIELGYQVSPKFSVGVAHRMTWALNDYIDGQTYNQYNNDFSDDNDKYHYTNLYLRWKLGRGKTKTKYNDFETGQTIDPAPGTSGTYAPNGPAPSIRIARPTTNPYTIKTSRTELIAHVKHVKSKRDIRVTYNGRSTNFAFNNQTGKLFLDLNLNPGTNIVEILATNEFGQEEKGKTIIYEQPTQGPYNPSPTPTNPPSTSTTNPNDPMGTNTGNTEQPPVVNITSPGQNPYETSSTRVRIRATIQNVSSNNQLQFSLNGQNYNNFSFNPSTRAFSAEFNMTQEQVYVSIKAVNTVGEDADTRTIKLKGTPPSNGPVCDPMGGNTGNPPTTGNPPIVTISTPATATSATTNGTASIKGKITNVTSKQNIVFSVNGVANTNYTFNTSTGAFTSTINLNTGNNIVSLTGSNNYGADRETRTIKHTQGLEVVVKPTVKITTPQPNPYTTAVPSTLLVATIKNVKSKKDITVLVNGTPIKSFSFNGQQLNTTVSLNQGSNTVIVRAVNSSGSASDTQSIVYHVAVETPVVKITTPKSNPHTTATNSTAIQATVLNVPDSRSINFVINGQSIRNFTYNATTDVLNANITLNKGSNSIKITATNSAGSDSDSRSIVYHTPIPKPVVTITTPKSKIETYRVETALIKATILNITSSSQIKFLVNGRENTKFSYYPKSKTFESRLNIPVGNTAIEIIASNKVGSDSDSRTLIRRKSATIPTAPSGNPPKVVITRPVQNTINVTGATYRVNAEITGVKSKNAITVMLNGREITNFTYSLTTGKLIAAVGLSSGNNLVKISAVNSFGSDSDNATIIYNTGTVNPGGILITSDPKDVEAPDAPPTGTGGVSIPTPNGNPTPPQPPTAPKTTTTLGKGKNSAPAKNPLTKPVSKPSISIAQPENLRFITTPTVNLTGIARYLTDRSKLQISVNGKAISNFNLDGRTGAYSASILMTEGRNKIEVSGTNAIGNNKKNITVYYSRERVKPVVFTMGRSMLSTKGSKKTVKAIIANIKDKSSIQLLVNGTPQTGFTYNSRSKLFVADITLRSGSNRVEVVAKGSETVKKSWTINKK